MSVRKDRGRGNFSFLLLLIVAVILLSSPGLFMARAKASAPRLARTPRMRPAQALDAQRQAAMEKLLSQLKAGEQFSEEETLILRRFGSGTVLFELEADVVISRALYDRFVAHRPLTREQQDLLGRYSDFAAHRHHGIADRKTELLNQRKAAAAAAPPRNTPLVAPPNDTCAGAEVIPAAGPFPYLTAITADITDATIAGDPPPASCQTDVSRSIWYTFTPASTATYVVSSCSDAPTGTTVDDTVTAIYTSSGGCAGPFTEIPFSASTNGCNDDAECGTEIFQAVISTQLTAGTQYYIIVWEFGGAPPTPGNTAVQLRVSRIATPGNDTCSAPTTLSLNTPVDGTTIAANNDYQLSGAGCFTGIGQLVSTATGRDVVYSFTAPVAANYSFRVTGYDMHDDLVLYIASSCPAGPFPQTVACLAAANRDTGSTAEEIMCFPLSASQQVFVFVDEDFSVPNPAKMGSNFTIEVNQCIQESEPNDTPGTANAITLPVFGLEGSISPLGTDVDFFSLGTVAANSRVFAMVDGISGNAPRDFDLRVTTSTDTLEYDDLDNDDPFGARSPNVAGTPTPAAPTQIFLKVDQNSGSPFEPYRLYAVVQPLIASATSEVEPNNTTGQANSAANNYFYGALSGPSPSNDIDVYAFSAQAGTLVYLGLDCDPLRDNTPIDGQLELLNSAGVTLVLVNDGESISCTADPCPTYPSCTHPSLTCFSPQFPGEGLVYRIRTTGTYYARVSISPLAPVIASAGDYLLSISGAVPTAAKFANETVSSVAKATGYASGVSIQWQTGFEVDNLGFNIYREQGGNRIRVNPQMIAGSALAVGLGTALGAGRSYSWFDNQPANGKTQYWIEAFDINGQSSWRGPISSSPAKTQLSSLQLTSATLAELGQGSAPAASSSPVERTAAVSMAAASSDTSHPALAGQPAVKLAINSEGIYRVTQPELTAAGFDPRVNPGVIEVCADGRELAINTIGKSGRFDSSAAIEFYGIGIDSVSTDKHVYWVVAGSQPGKRMQQLSSSSKQLASGSFPYTVELKERTVYFSGLRNGEKENFFGAVVARDPVDRAISVQHLDSGSASATLEVALQGVTAGAHQVDVWINGAKVGTVAFNSQSEGVARLAIAQSTLKEGSNAVRLIAQGGRSDISLLDYLRLTYPHSYVADGDRLKFTTAAKEVGVDGFTRPAIRVFDVTDDGAPRELLGTIRHSKNGYSVALRNAATGQRTLIATAGDSLKQVASAAANQPSHWREPGLGANLLIISRRDFFSALEPLKKLRMSQGYTVELVDVEDIYDEFSYGNKSPQAIKDFLAYARSSWKISPAFVIFAGDASLDPRNYLGFGDDDFVPTKLIDTAAMETASDDWFADQEGDGRPEIAVGRLPVRTPGEAASMVAKIIRYDQTLSPSTALLVADADDSHDFQIASRELRALIPAGVKTQEIYRGMLDSAMTARKQLLDALSRGPRLVNYSGHGNANAWRSGLLTSDDARSLRNADSLTFFVMMTCLNGYFQDAQFDSLAEALMKAQRGGAIAVWASSGMTSPGDQSLMDIEAFKWLFDFKRSWTLGEVVLKAKASVRNSDARRTWILFGDPTTRLR